jgi:hypothetical protein
MKVLNFYSQVFGDQLRHAALHGSAVVAAAPLESVRILPDPDLPPNPLGTYGAVTRQAAALAAWCASGLQI